MKIHYVKIVKLRVGDRIDSELARQEQVLRDLKSARRRWRLILDVESLHLAVLLLAKEGEYMLANWLLHVKIAHLWDVTAGIAVHALLRIPPEDGKPHPWDVLMATSLINHQQAFDWFDADEVFEWEPRPDWLVRCG
jgi:hypothetical protein